MNYGALCEDGVSCNLIEGDPFGEIKVTDTIVSISDVLRYKPLPPVKPAAIFCIGLNYKRHATECGLPFPEMPVLFYKPPSAACAHGDTVFIPHIAKPEEMDYECELAVVIGKPCKNVSREEALDYVLGYTCANDVSARWWQMNSGGGQWNRGKCFDTFCPLGPCIVTTDEIPDPNVLQIKTTLNGKVMQASLRAPTRNVRSLHLGWRGRTPTPRI